MNPDTVQVMVRVVSVGEITWRLFTGPGEEYDAADVLTVGAALVVGTVVIGAAMVGTAVV